MSTSEPPIGVAIAASTGGPNALIYLFRRVRRSFPAAVFLVQHGPAWMLPLLAGRLRKETDLEVVLAVDGASAAPGRVALAPGDRHLEVEPSTLALIVRD